MRLSLSEQLWFKLEEQFPQIPNLNHLKLERVYGANDGTHFSWVAVRRRGSPDIFLPSLFSYSGMKECLQGQLELVFREGHGHGPRGWEVVVKETETPTFFNVRVSDT